MDFLNALADPAIPFLRHALLSGILASVAFGIIGTYVVARRITSIAGAISHCVLGGIGAGLYLEHAMGVTWFGPLSGAVVAALAAAIIIGLVSLHAQQREDTAIGALWSIGMAVGLLFIAKTPGYVDPMSYLFGNILLISRSDLWLVLALDGVVTGVAALFYHQFLAVCFDEEYARLRGVRSDLFYLLLLCLTALTVVLLVRVVGIVMVIALLTLPAAVAGSFARNLSQMMVLATLCSMAFISSGLAVSYSYDLPSGPTIIVLAGMVYLLVLAGKRLFSRRA
ncbi:MAG TPA: metal ABC transporter permease [Desulfurivibrionaceae bacterium]|nr:metal ABC transporter permease [Desulfurivibrionaceae bacterium]